MESAMESNAGDAVEAVRGATGNVQETLAHQLENHPGRTAVIALGMGVLIDRASKR